MIRPDAGASTGRSTTTEPHHRTAPMTTHLLPLVVRMQVLFTSTSRRLERGASLVEYALLVALIALVCIAAVTTFGAKTGSSFKSTAGAL
jgi:pilus assembly protein Flp/PilA